jgi:hypothetical protein
MNQMTEVAKETEIEPVNIVTTATRCSCGRAVSIIEDGLMPPYTSQWAAFCADCYRGPICVRAPEEDAGDRAHVIGRGASMDEALWAWQAAHDKAWHVEWRITEPPLRALARQESEEADRQRGWGYSPEPSYPTARLYGPVEASCRA